MTEERLLNRKTDETDSERPPKGRLHTQPIFRSQQKHTVRKTTIMNPEPEHKSVEQLAEDAHLLRQKIAAIDQQIQKLNKKRQEPKPDHQPISQNFSRQIITSSLKAERDELLKEVLKNQRRYRLQEAIKQIRERDQRKQLQNPFANEFMPITTTLINHGNLIDTISRQHTQPQDIIEPRNIRRNDFNQIREHQKRYMEIVRRRRNKLNPIETRESFTLRTMEDQKKKQQALKRIDRRQEYALNLLRKSRSEPRKLKKMDVLEDKIKVDVEQHPGKYWKLQKLKNMSLKNIYMEKNTEIMEQEVIKETGNRYLQEIKKKIKKDGRSNSEKQSEKQSLNDESFSISKRYTNYLPSLNLSRINRRQKPNIDNVKSQAEDLEKRMIRKIAHYVEERKRGINYFAKGDVQEDIDESMIKAIRAKIACAQLI